jgi:N-hydroxyarylamine O-acetyltransferase
MDSQIDLDAYLERIGYAGERTATLETLRALHELHPRAIPFENLDPLLRMIVGLDIASLQKKLLRERRGGYCFEHNLLFMYALQALGFHIRGLGGRVLWGTPEGTIARRTHMLLHVEMADGSYVADVGFGAVTPTGPLRLQENIEQMTPHEPFRIVRIEGDYATQALVRGTWRTLYRYDLQQQFLPDYEVANWYLSNHPQSYFLTHLIAARALPDRRYALLNNELATHVLNGDTVRTRLNSAAELRMTLRDVFGIALPHAAGLDVTLEHAAQLTARWDD